MPDDEIQELTRTIREFEVQISRHQIGTPLPAHVYPQKLLAEQRLEALLAQRPNHARKI